MNILLFTNPVEDYLQDCLIHGFKVLLGKQAYDFPTKDIMYSDYKDYHKIRGGGFTLYGLIDENLKTNLKEPDLIELIKSGFFDLVVFTSIHRQYNYWLEYKKYFYQSKSKLIFCDGEDDGAIFPYYGRYREITTFLRLQKFHKKYHYFKREINEDTLRYMYWKIIPSKYLDDKKLGKYVKEISFSIPSTKIIKEKTKIIWQTHSRFGGCLKSYWFRS